MSSHERRRSARRRSGPRQRGDTAPRTRDSRAYRWTVETLASAVCSPDARRKTATWPRPRRPHHLVEKVTLSHRSSCRWPCNARARLRGARLRTGNSGDTVEAGPAVTGVHRRYSSRFVVAVRPAIGETGYLSQDGGWVGSINVRRRPGGRAARVRQETWRGCSSYADVRIGGL